MPNNSQGQIQTQTQSQVQIQTLSPQQVLEAKILELSTIEIEERVRAEIIDNPALDEGHDESISDYDEINDETDNPEYNTANGNDLSADSYSGDEDDEMDYASGSSDAIWRTNIIEQRYSESKSLYDTLLEQLAEQDLTNEEYLVGKQIICSLDENGFLDKNLISISDDLAFNHNLDISTEYIERVLSVIQSFEPAGVGARSLQEALIIQLSRRSGMQLEISILTQCYEEFTRKRIDKIVQKLQIDRDRVERAIVNIQHLNPKPGASIDGERFTSNQEIIPDFIVESIDEKILFTLNNFNIPELRISKNFSSMLDEQIKRGNNPSQREAALYTKSKLDSAKGFIQALKQRERTMYTTMKAIIDIQQPFFFDGNLSRLKPMRLKDVSEITGLDIATISRTTKDKYVQTNFGIFPLKSLFTDGVKDESGQEVSVKEIHNIISSYIEGEDGSNPRTDEQISEHLKGLGYNIARRTIAKYREQLGIPVARLRKI